MEIAITYPSAARIPGTRAAWNMVTMFASTAIAKMTRTSDGGIRMPRVPPAASAPVASAPEYL